MEKSASELWSDCLLDFKEQLSPSQYTSFFEPISFESFDENSRTLVLRIPTKQLAEFLETKCLPLLSKILTPRFGQIRLKYHITSPTTTGDATSNTEKKEQKESVQIATNLNSHYTFNTFIEGKSNKLARSVGLTIAEHPSKTTFIPMFIFGPSGCGKTHLAHAMGNKVVALYPQKKVLYVPAREFQRQYTDSVINKETNDFIHFYQQFDMLIVDDVQEWESSPKTTETFFHIFNDLYMRRKLIILIADRTPSELRNMDERMLTRFNQGILAEMERPNHHLCIEILNAKIRRDGLVIPTNVVEYIAQNANGSVRDLEGVINSLLAHSIFIDGDIDIALAEKVVGRFKRDTPQKYDVSQILDIVCAHFKVPEEDVLGKSRKREYVQARQIAMYFSHTLGKVNVNRIGRLIGNRDHSTVAHSIEKVATLIKKDKAYAREIKNVEREIKASKGK